MTPNEIVAIVKDGITAAGVMIGTGIAYSGLQTWKRQLHGNARFELSRRILKTTYAVREAMANARSPVISAGEHESARVGAKLPADISQENQMAIRLAVYNVRWKAVFDAKTEFNSGLLEAEVMFGKESRLACEGLLQCTKDLYFAIEDMLGEGPDLSVEERRRARDIGFESRSKPEFTSKIEKAVTEIESLLRPHLMI